MTFEFFLASLFRSSTPALQPDMYFSRVLELVSVSKRDAPTRAALLNGRGVVTIERGVDGARL
jgi:hypothetical protein